MRTFFSFFKRIIPIMMVYLLTTGNLLAANPGGKILYLNPTTDYWNQNNAWFALYVWGTGGSPNNWAAFSEMGSTGIYAVTVPTGTYEGGLIILRKDPNYTGLDWNSEWNRSGNQTYDGSKNLFTITGWDYSGSWSNYAPPLQSATLAATGYRSGSGTSADPYIVYKDHSAILTTTATQYVTDADMIVETALVTNGTTGNFTTGTSITYTPSDTGTYSIQTKARNKKNYGTSTTGEEYTTNTLYFSVLEPPYRLRSTTADGRIFYSNSGAAGDTLSTYCNVNAGIGSLWLQRIDGGEWKNISQQTPSGVDSMLIIGIVNETATDTTVSIQAYSGNIYVRTDDAAGGWNNYLQNDANRMTQWAPNRSLASEYYDYYWLKWITPGINVKACVANEYNKNLANTIGDLTLTIGANTRFAYDSKTNTFYRNLIGGAGTTKFLEITECKVNPDSALIRDTNNVGIGYKGSDGKILSDVSNWTYYIDTYCYPGAAVHLEGTQQDIGTEVLVDSLVVLSSSTSPQKKFRIRLIYHFAQNRIVHAWLPDSSSINSDYQIGSGILFIRQDDSITNTLNMQKSTPATVVANRIYFSLEINKTAWLKKKAAQQQVYFFSLPYTCKIEDIYGSFDKTDYGTKWLIQRYRGDKRAQYGLTVGSNYWANMNLTATLEAGRGYVLLTNFTTSDFKEANGIERLRFYFPSEKSNFTFSYKGTLMDTLEAYPCTINIPDSLLIVGIGYGDRRQLDNNWHVRGIPGLKTMTVDNVNMYDSVPTAPNYVYKYTMRTSTDHSEASQYKLFSTLGGTFTMEPFFSYFMQYAGRIQWTDYTATAPTLAPRRISEATQTTESYPIVLSHENGTDDQMFITLSTNGKTDFESDRDILKMLVTGKNFPQVYANMQNEKWGAIDLPNETQTVILGFYSCTDGTHNIALTPNSTQNAQSIILYDKEQNCYHDLQNSNYSFTATQGTYNERFEITISKNTSITTQIAKTESISCHAYAAGNMLVVENLPEQTLVRLFDIAGQYIASSRSSYGQIHFGPLPAGIYLLNVQGVESRCFKVIVK